MNDLTLEGLQNSFKSEWACISNLVGVLIELPNGSVETIINHCENFSEKIRYYSLVYDENLNHKFSDGIKIVGWAFGDTFDDIEKELFGFVGE